MNSVLISAGSRDTFSVVYLLSNKSSVKFGIPFINMYAIIKISASIVINAARHTERKRTKDLGSRLYVHHFRFNFPTIYFTLLLNRERDRLIMRMKTNRTTAVPINASRCKSVEYPISNTMFVVSVRTPESILSGMAG